jgi:hypothetical protein
MASRACRPHEAAAIVKLCISAGVPEQAAQWLEEGYDVAAVAGNLRTAAKTAPRPPPKTRRPARQFPRAATSGLSSIRRSKRDSLNNAVAYSPK